MHYETDLATIYCMTSSARIRREEETIERDMTEGLQFLAVKNEYESAQLVIRAKEDLTFALKSDDLANEKGDILSKENFACYYEKYIQVDRNWRKNGYPTGYYPDALIPEAAPALHGENMIQKGENGAVFVDLKIPKDQPAGVYRGFFTLYAGRPVPVAVFVHVLDLTLEEETTSKSLFAVSASYMEHFEGEKSQELYEKYGACLRRHRLSSTNPYFCDDEYPYSEWTRACAEAIEKGASTISVPTPPLKSERWGEIVDEEDFIKRLVALKDKSFEIGKNLVAYVRHYEWMTDEPFGVKYPDGKVKYCIERWPMILKKAAESCKEDPRMDTPLGQEILQSMAVIPNVHTDFYDRFTPRMREVLDENGQPYTYDVTKVTLCPRFEGYDHPSQRACYKNEGERWWYGCNAPNAPYPGYHIDDIGYSARIIGWMMAEYDIRGNLYWLTNDGMNMNVVPATFLEDIYSYPAHHGAGSNGEGILMYPGRPYGIYGPVETIRLKAIRDGNEEYEFLKRLIHGYAQKGVDALHIISRITAALYSGTRIDAEGRYFDRSREAVLYLLELHERYGLTLDVAKTEQGTWKLTARADDDFSFTVDGRAAEQTENGRVCLAEKKMGFAALEFVFGGETRNLSLFVGNGVKIILHEELFEQRAITGEFTSMTINYHDIYRELRIQPEGNKPQLKLHFEEDLSQYTLCDLLLRAEKETGCIVRNNGATVAEVTLHNGWNRVHTKAEQLSGNILELTLSENAEIAFGEVYLFH